MYPREHAAVSAAVVGIAAVFYSLPLQETAVWLVIGVAAGVFIDIDHLVLAAVFGKRQEVGQWLRRPVKALLNPAELLEDLEYGSQALYYHRIAAHIAIIAAASAAMTAYPALFPAVLALVTHLLSDIVWDLYHGNYQGHNWW